MQAFTPVYNSDPVANWMTRDVIYVQDDTLVSEVIAILDNHTIFGIPVVDDAHLFLGLISKTVIMNNIANASVFMLPVSEIMLKECETSHPTSSISEASQLEGGCLPVVDDDGKLVGIITRTDIIRANASQLAEVKQQVDSAETLKLVLNSAYEGVVVVNRDGYIQEINDSYCRIINRERADIIGRKVTDIIENTRLHIIAKSGVEERGHLQRIAGLDLVVHRIPIFKNQQVVGAIGMLIFKDISEMNAIYNRLNTQKNMQQTQKKESKQRKQAILKEIIGESQLMKAAKNRALKAANCTSTVFISGSSGTGKEVFAKAIHEMSSFAQGKFMCVNCSAIPETLIESELFGYEDGAFTDAKRGGKKGKFELADEGTIFLDEIGDMPYEMQAKLLRFIQERTIERVGSTEQKRVNVRIITATHRNLVEMVAAGTFRADLYYRIHVIPLHLPDLSERRQDIATFLEQNLLRFCQQFGFKAKRFTAEAITCLENYQWPGNVRELLNVTEALVALTENEVITVADLPVHIQQFAPGVSTEQGSLTLIALQEKELIASALLAHRHNKTAVSKELGIPRSTLYEKIKRYELS